uniref:Uncharacterized protein n=1 Tax=Fagus sylvatica TaxID=28930 RepID=A0A2N9F6X9_FAGSY
MQLTKSAGSQEKLSQIPTPLVPKHDQMLWVAGIKANFQLVGNREALVAAVLCNGDEQLVVQALKKGNQDIVWEIHTVVQPFKTLRSC